jgi:hypothetical protein
VPARKADNLTAISQPIVLKLWEPRLLATLWTSAACCRDNFTYFRLFKDAFFNSVDAESSDWVRVNNDLNRLWKESVLTQLKIQYHHLLVKTK